MNQAASFISQQGTPSPATAYQPESATASPPFGTEPVGQGRLIGTLTDEQREAAILQAGKLVEKYMAEKAKYERDYDITNHFGDKGAADASKIKAQEAARLMAELIRGRSPEVVARLEAERGLSGR